MPRSFCKCVWIISLRNLSQKRGGSLEYERVRRWSIRSPVASHVEQTHLWSNGVVASSCWMDSSRVRWEGEGGFSSSQASSEDETRIGPEDGTISKIARGPRMAHTKHWIVLASREIFIKFKIFSNNYFIEIRLKSITFDIFRISNKNALLTFRL